MTATVVGLAMSPRAWRSSFHRHCRDHSADLAVRLVRDAGEALDAGIDVVVVDDDTSWVSVPFVVAARDRSLTVIGLYDPDEGDGHGRRFLQRLGVDLVYSADVGNDGLVEIVEAQRPDTELRERFEEIVGVDSSRIAPDERMVIGVGGPAGSGATEVSIALANAAGGESILVDVDESHPTIARRLGLGIHPHILTAIEALRGERIRPDGVEGQELSDCLAARATEGPGLGFEVLVGLAARDDWSLLRPDDTVDLVEELAARWPLVIVRLGPSLEDLSHWVGRFDVSRRVAERADRIVGVCEGTSTGLLRFVDWLVDLSVLVGDTPIDVIVNQAPRSASARRQLVDQLREIVGGRVGRIEVAGRDSTVERASWDAVPVGRGSFAKTVKALL